MKKQKELKVCDFCKEHNYDNFSICKVCGKLFCFDCGLDDTWKFTDTPLCESCGEIVREKFPKFIEEISKEIQLKVKK